MEYQVVKAHDVEEVIPLVKEHMNFAGLEYSESRTRAVITDLVHSCGDNGKVFLLLIDKDSVPVGYLAGIAMDHVLTDRSFTSEIGFFCKAKGQGKKLIKAFEEWSKEQKVDFITLASYGDTELKLRPYYERLGYSIKDTTYGKDL